LSDNEFIFYWFLTFFIWNIYYLWIVPKRSAQFWAKRFETKDGQKELVKIARGIIDTTVEETNILIEEQLEAFSKKFFGSLGKNVQETKQLIKLANPESDLLEKIGEQNPILGLIVQRLGPQLSGLMGNQDKPPNSYNKGV